MRRCELAAVALLALAGTAVADDDAAEKAYQSGRSHYDLHEWDQAIADFKEAYRLRGDAASLFNIAQSYRLAGDCVQAASFYRTYRRNFPNEKNIARVDGFITEMDECAKKAPPPDTTKTGTPPAGGPATGGAPTGAAAAGPAVAPSPTGSAPAASVSASSGHESHTNTGLAITGIAVAGVGVACIVGGTLFAVRAQNIEDEIMQLPRWDPDLDDSGHRADITAKVLLGVGGAAVIGGGVLMFLGLRATESAPAVSVAPRAGGASISWSGSF